MNKCQYCFTVNQYHSPSCPTRRQVRSDQEYREILESSAYDLLDIEDLKWIDKMIQ